MNKSEKLIYSLTDDDAAILLALLGTTYATIENSSSKRNIDIVFQLKYGITMQEFLDGVGIDKIMEKAQQ